MDWSKVVGDCVFEPGPLWRRQPTKATGKTARVVTQVLKLPCMCLITPSGKVGPTFSLAERICRVNGQSCLSEGEIYCEMRPEELGAN